MTQQPIRLTKDWSMGTLGSLTTIEIGGTPY